MATHADVTTSCSFVAITHQSQCSFLLNPESTKNLGNTVSHY